jgi:hypothetical protein
MTKLGYSIFFLGLLTLAPSARASLTYQSSQATFTNQATVTDALTVSSLITFTGSFSEFGTVNNDEYIDPLTGVEFIAFNASGTTNKAFASVSGGVLNTAASQGDSIEVILPAGTYGLAFDFTTVFPSGETLCADVVVSSCASGGTFVTQNASGFIGGLNDNPTPAPVTAIWLHPINSAGTDLIDFEIATQGSQSDTAPDPATMLTLGSGLVLLALLRRRTRLFRFLNR